MEFGIFDHLDRSALPLKAFYEQRLAFAEAYDRGGYYCYHMAEHHCTPLGVASAPSVFMAALAQRTRQLRFGPLVYTLTVHHPLNLIEEICMLDQMSGGRFQLGIGRGVSPIETGYFGVDPNQKAELYEETLAAVLKGLAGKILDFEGKFFRFRAVPMELEPWQKPHPPIWLGVTSPASAERAGRNGHNFVTLGDTKDIRVLTEHYRKGWAEAGKGAPIPLHGMGRFVILAETDEAALAVARRAYPKWHQSFNYLFRLHGRGPVFGERPPEFDQTTHGGRGIAGSPETVIKLLRSQIEEARVNYFVAQFAFGDLSGEEVMRSIDLFARHVMPALKDA